MPKYILKTLDSNVNGGLRGSNRPFERNLVNLSALGIKWNSEVINQVRTNVDLGQDQNGMGGSNTGMMFLGEDLYTRAHQNIAGNNKYIAFHDQSYIMRRDFLRKFALQDEIDNVLETIADVVHFRFNRVEKSSRDRCKFLTAKERALQ